LNKLLHIGKILFEQPVTVYNLLIGIELL
jgi:hypothetical protein